MADRSARDVLADAVRVALVGPNAGPLDAVYSAGEAADAGLAALADAGYEVRRKADAPEGEVERLAEVLSRAAVEVRFTDDNTGPNYFAGMARYILARGPWGSVAVLADPSPCRRNQASPDSVWRPCSGCPACLRPLPSAGEPPCETCGGLGEVSKVGSVDSSGFAPGPCPACSGEGR